MILRKKNLINKAILLVVTIATLVIGVIIGVQASTATKNQPFQVGISFNPRYLYELTAWLDVNADSQINNGEIVFPLFNNSGPLDLNENVSISGNVLNINSSFAAASAENLKIKFTNLTQPRLNHNNQISEVLISVFITASNTNGGLVQISGSTELHNLAQNESGALSANVATGLERIIYSIEILERVPIDVDLTNLSLSNTYLFENRNLETKLSAESGYIIPESQNDISLTLIQPDGRSINLSAEMFSYNSNSGELTIAASTLKAIFSSLPKPLSSGSLRISATAPKNIYTTLTVNITGASLTNTPNSKDCLVYISTTGSSGRERFIGRMENAINSPQTFVLRFTDPPAANEKIYLIFIFEDLTPDPKPSSYKNACVKPSLFQGMRDFSCFYAGGSGGFRYEYIYGYINSQNIEITASLYSSTVYPYGMP